MPTLDTLTRNVRAELAHLTETHPEDWFLVFRARYGIETVLTVLKNQQGSGEVITQPFTCATAINPILSAGHVPVYVDASYDDFSLDTTKLQTSSACRALIMQHSFSLESNIVKARAFANKHGLLLIEDSAHHVGMMAKKDGEPLADVSIHSFGVEKLLPTKFGGAVWINPAMNNRALRDALRSDLERLPLVSRKQAGLARRYRFFNRLLNHTPALLEPSFRSFLVTTCLFQPAIMPDELNGKNHDTPAQPDTFIMEEMLSGLKQYKQTVNKREQASSVYQNALSTSFTLPKNLPEEYAPARFPVLCKDAREATRLFDTLRRAGHYSGKWYRPTLFPGVLDAKLYNYDPELCPVAEDISARILNLPTNVTAHEAKEIADALQREIA